MAEQVIPQKRPLDQEVPKHGYLTRAKVDISTPEPSAPILAKKLNKFAPVIAWKPADFTPETRFTKDEVPLNVRRGFQYHPCAPAPNFFVLKFATTDAPPYSAGLSIFDRSTSTEFVRDGKAVTTTGGWVSSRANVGITEGSVFFEFIVHESDANRHVRLGLARREASIEAPVGFDGYGYGLRDLQGNTLHLSRPKEFGLEGFGSGDVIGVLVELPKQEEFQDIVREQIAIRFRSKAFFEKLDYAPSKEMDHLLNPVTVFGEKAVPDTNRWKPETLGGSKITIYKNGKHVGVAFEDLYSFLPPNSELKTDYEPSKHLNNGTLGYYPTISVFRGGVAELNAGPDFRFKPEGLPQDTQGLHELYTFKIADDIVWDIIDEIEAEAFDDPTLESFF